MRDDVRSVASYGAIEGEGDVEATPLEGDRARATALVRGRKRLGLGLVAVACVGALARTRGMFAASLGSAPLAPELGLEDGAYYARGGKHRLRDPWLRIDGANVPMSNMTEEQKSANVVNWCRFAGNSNFRCGVPCRQSQENGPDAPEVFHIGTTPADADGKVYRTISRKGEDGNLYVCYADWFGRTGWNRKVMQCPTSGDKAILTNSASLPEGAKLTISTVPNDKRHTNNVEYLNNMGTLYTMVNKELAAHDGSGKGLCWDFGASTACHARVNDNTIKNVNAQFEFVSVVPDASGHVSACPA